VAAYIIGSAAHQEGRPQSQPDRRFDWQSQAIVKL
jgi:hypothetical protein